MKDKVLPEGALVLCGRVERVVRRRAANKNHKTSEQLFHHCYLLHIRMLSLMITFFVESRAS